MKKKRFAAAVLSLVLLLSAATPVFAAEQMPLLGVEQNYVATFPLGTSLAVAAEALPSRATATVQDTSAFGMVTPATYTFDSAVGDDWTLLSDQITVSDGKLQFAKNSNIKAVVGSEEMTDYIVECDITFAETPTSNAGLMFRTTDATNKGADSYNGYYVGIGETDGTFGVVIGYADGAWHQLALKERPVAANVRYTLRVLVYDSVFYVQLQAGDDSEFETVYSGEVALYANGNVGLRSFQQAFAVDDFKISAMTDAALAEIGVMRTKTVSVPVAQWSCAEYDGEVAGRYEFFGTVGDSGYANPNNWSAKAVVTVKETPTMVEFAHSVPFSQVTVEDTYWNNLQKQFICKVIPVAIRNISTQTGGMENFRIASEYLATKSGNYTTTDAPRHGGAIYVDSDDYKVIEAMCYALTLDAKGDEEMLAGQAAIKAELEKWIPWIVGSQEADGYLYTPYTLTYVNSKRSADMRFTGRTDDMPVHTDGSLYDTVGTADYASGVNMDNHELYCAGHFYEAAVAHYRATGDFRLLDVAVKNADLVARTCGMGEGQAYVVPGHQEIELALIKLANLCTEIGTANGTDYAAKADSYIAVAKFFLDERGNNSEYHKPLGGNGVYYQNDKPVAEQTTAYGHCVRANYMYTAMADVALLELAEGRENPYDTALNSIWKDMLTKMYIHGGIGIPSGESYSESYVLPNDGAYCETCAQISNVMWNQRMNLLYGDAKYVDLMEWTLYNSVVSCVNFDGDRFFYQNHMNSESDFTRSVWFGTACCPPNLLRTVASIGGYIYTQNGEGDITVNQYIGNTAELNVGGAPVEISMTGSFPWDGDATLTVNKSAENAFAIRFRIPEWAKGENVVTLNGENVPVTLDASGYLVLDRVWAAGDTVALSFPMEAERIYSDENVVANAGLVAVRRGPIIYCIESPDNTGDVFSAVLPTDAKLTVSALTKLPGRESDDIYNVENIRTITFDGLYRNLFTGESAGKITLIPYYAWNNRGYSDMSVYLTENVVAYDKPLEYYATPSASYTCATDSLAALHDGLFAPAKRWTAYGSSTNANYIEYAFDGEVTLRGSWVTWYHDGGGVQVPEALDICYWDGSAWKSVAGLTGTDNFPKNNGSSVSGEAYYGHDAVTTTKIRLYPTNSKTTKTVAQPGIVEWRLDGEVANGAIALPKIYEAENGIRTGVAAKTNNLASTSSANGYVGMIDNAESSVTMDVYMPSAGVYDMEITYAGVSGYPNASHKLFVNGKYVQTVAYAELAGWTAWRKTTVQIELPAGESTITLAYNDALENSFARVDCIKLTGVPLVAEDINKDGKVSVADVLTLLRDYLNGRAVRGDFNGDGTINLADVICLLRKITEA